MFFFGQFLDGPLAGSTFEGTTDTGSGGDFIGGFVAMGFGAAVFAIIFCIVVGPFVVWPLLFESDIREGRGILGAVLVLAVQILYICLRTRSCVKHWHAGFVKELCLNVVFLIAFTFMACVVLLVPLSRIYLEPAQAQLVTEHYGELVKYMISNATSNLPQFIFFYYCLSVLPAGMITLFSRLLCGRAAKSRKVKPAVN